MRPEKQGEDRAQLAVGLLEEALAEHSFGTIKRAWGYTYTLLRRRPKVSAEFSLIYTVYNMRRNVSLLTPHGLVRALKNWNLDLKWVEFAIQTLFLAATMQERQIDQMEDHWNFRSNVNYCNPLFSYY